MLTVEQDIMTTIPTYGEGTPSPDTQHPSVGCEATQNSKQTLLISVETRHLVLLKRGARYYVTLPTLAGLMTRTPYEQGLGILSHLLYKVRDILPAGSCLKLPPSGRVVKLEHELTALSLPAALTMLSRSNMKDMLALHDMLLAQMQALYFPVIPPEVQE